MYREGLQILFSGGEHLEHRTCLQEDHDDRCSIGLSIIELASRSSRELVLKKFQGGLSLHDSNGNVLKTSRAKSALQLRRNANLRRALAG